MPDPDALIALRAAMTNAGMAATAPRQYTRKPLADDLLAASWPADPLTDEEEAAYAEASREAGYPPIPRASRERWPAFNAMIRQGLAAAAAAQAPTPAPDR